MKNFFQIFVKTALCGVVGSERVFKIYGNGYPFPMPAPKLITLANAERKGKEWIENWKSRTAAWSIVIYFLPLLCF